MQRIEQESNWSDIYKVNRQSTMVWSKMSKSKMPTWVLELLNNLRHVIVVTDSDCVMWRCEYSHLEMTIDKILSYAKEGNLLDHRTYYTETD